MRGHTLVSGGGPNLLRKIAFLGGAVALVGSSLFMTGFGAQAAAKVDATNYTVS